MSDDERPFAPLKPDHPLVGEECPACSSPFAGGDVTTLVFLGPGEDEEARERARLGRSYTGVASPIHWACRTGSEDPVRDYEAWFAQQ